MEKVRGQMQYVALFIFLVSCLLLFIITAAVGPDLARAFSDGTSNRSLFPVTGLGFISANLFPIIFVGFPLLLLIGGVMLFRSGG